MTTGVIIYEKDKYILRTLIERLRIKMPESYIIDGSNESETQHIVKLCDECIIIYDQRQYGKNAFSDKRKVLPLFEDGVIDCKKIIKPIRIDPGHRKFKNESEGITLLLPFVYISERENFINSRLNSLRECDVCLRFDLVSRVTCSPKYGESLTDLLNNVYKKKFDAVDILDYCALDDRGFFTPGCLSVKDDINDHPVSAFSNLVTKTKELTDDKDKNACALIVAEGLNNKAVFEIAGKCNRIILLLPDEVSQDRPGMCEFIAGLSRSCNGKDIEIKTIINEENYEPAI